MTDKSNSHTQNTADKKMISWIVAAIFKSFLILLTLLFINRFLKFDYSWVNYLEEAIGKATDWFKAHNLNLKNNLYAIATFLGLAILVNWYAELDNPVLNAVGWEILGFFQSDAWSNLIPALDSVTKILIYAIMIVALNRFFRLKVEVVERLDHWLYDVMDRLILSHGGAFELITKNAMTLLVAMLVNHHAQIGFVPLTILEQKTVWALGLEGLGEGSAARRRRKMCEREREMFQMRVDMLSNAMFTAEANGEAEAAVRLRNSLDNVRDEASDCQAQLGADQWE
ncbi:MAG: hypothetical protein OEV92_02465 [Nitrospinota bacterium]|nr:hypothetical protein [Nitrospinota bacterium]